jgi:hypothetical protein
MSSSKTNKEDRKELCLVETQLIMESSENERDPKPDPNNIKGRRKHYSFHF